MSVIDRNGNTLTAEVEVASLRLDSESIGQLDKLQLQGIDRIELTFPKFTDGRAYSIARELRERYHYAGELRAVGEVLVDQLSLMARVGFDSFALRADQDIGVAQGLLALARAERRHYYQPDFGLLSESVIEQRHG